MAWRRLRRLLKQIQAGIVRKCVLAMRGRNLRSFKYAVTTLLEWLQVSKKRKNDLGKL
jgi:hypothetical protein